MQIMTEEMAAAAPAIVALGSYQALKQSKVIDHILRLSNSSSPPNILDVCSNDDDHSVPLALFEEKGCTVKQCSPFDMHNFTQWADVIIYRCQDNVVQSDSFIDVIQNGTILCALPSVIPSKIIPAEFSFSIVESPDDETVEDLMKTNSSVIRIDDLAAFVIVGKNAMTVTGNKGSTCHVYTRNDSGETICGPLPTTWTEPIPIEEILQFPMPATASHLEALEEHVDTNFVIADDVLQKAAVDEGESNKNNNDDSAFPKIVACGRTETLQMQAIVDKVVELSGADLPKVLYIGTASFDRSDRYNVCTQKFREMGCEIKRLDVSENDTVPTMEVMKEMVVEWAEVIMCSGGNTLHALLRWKEVGLDLLMKEASLKGVVLCGGSAGAGCWFSSLQTDSLRPDNTKNKEHVKNELSEEELADWDYTKISALGFVDAMCVPHFDKKGTNGVERVEDAERILQESPTTPAIGVDENAALVIVGNEALAVSGDGKATCHVVVPDQVTGEMMSAPLPTTWEHPVPVEEVLDFPVPATASHLEALEEHVDTDFVVADDIAQAISEPVSSNDQQKGSENGTLPAVPQIKIVASGNERGMRLQPIVDKVVELSGSDLPKVLYIGTASFDRTDKFLRQTQAFREMGCEIKRLDVSEKDTVPTMEVMKEMVVEWAEVIMCSGGNTLHALLRWKEVGLDLLMKEASLKGVVLCGGSAGAGCWFSSLHTDSLRPDNTKNKEHVKNELSEEELADWDYTKISALGFVDAMCVPHFDATGTNGMKRSEHAEEMLKKDPSTLAIGVENDAALVIVGNEALAVSGDGKATCHVVVPDQVTGEMMSAPLPTTWKHPVPVEEVLDFPVPATASHLEALEEHVDTDFVVADDIAQAISEPVSSNDQQKGSENGTLPAVPQIKIVASGNERGMRLQPIVDKVVELSGTDLPKVLYIGTASFDRTDKFLRQTQAFREMGCEIRRLDVSENDTVPTMEVMKEMVVEWAEVIMCSGGNTLHALLRWKEVGLDLLMKEASLKGVVLCGGSAGAGCWFSSLHTDSLRPDNTKNKEHVKNELSEEELADWDYTKISALGFVDAMCVPHFDATGTNGMKRSEHAEEMLKKDPSTLAIGVENDAALVIVGNEALAVSGDGKATCHVVVPDQVTGEMMSAPLPTTWKHPVPVEEVLDFPVPATASHLEALEEHVDTDFVVADDIAQAISEPVSSNDQQKGSENGTLPAVPQIKIVASGNERGMRLQPIVDKVVELSGSDLPKVLYIGTASFDRTDKFLRQTQAFREMGCEIKRLDVSEKDTVPTMEVMKEMVVEWAEVIMCSGGNTLHALLRWKEVGLDLLMKEASLKGVVLCGGSAGAGCWFSSLHTDSLRPDNTKNKEHVKNELSEEELADWDYTKISALGFVDAMCVPHFDATGTNGMKRSEHAEEMLKKDPSTLAIGVENDAALVIVGNEALAVSGDGKATCHVVVPDQVTGEIKTSALCSKSNPVLVEKLLG